MIKVHTKDGIVFQLRCDHYGRRGLRLLVNILLDSPLVERVEVEEKISETHTYTREDRPK